LLSDCAIVIEILSPPCAEFLTPVICPLPPGVLESPGSSNLSSLIPPFLVSVAALSTPTPLPEPVIAYVALVYSSPACVNPNAKIWLALL
jgi:hypothetical protein